MTRYHAHRIRRHNPVTFLIEALSFLAVLVYVVVVLPLQ